MYVSMYTYIDMCAYMCVCMCIYIYNWIPLLYTWNQHNIVNQLYSKIKYKKKKKNSS